MEWELPGNNGEPEPSESAWWRDDPDGDRREEGFFDSVVGFVIGTGEVLYSTVTGVIDVAHGLWNIGPVRALYDPVGHEQSVRNFNAALSAIGEDPTILIDAFVEPIREDIEGGRPGEAIANGIFGIVGLKGIDKLAKLSKLKPVAGVNKLDDVADAGRTSNRGALVGRGSTAAPPKKPIGSSTFSDPAERALAEYLEGLGRQVSKNPMEGVAGAGRQGDAFVDGVLHEFKSLDSGAGAGTIKNVVNNSIRRGGQAREIVIDARGTGLTEVTAKKGAAQALGISRGKLDGLTILGDGYFFRWTPR